MKVPYLRSKYISIKIMFALPTIMEFDNLHLTENLLNAVKSIKGSSDICCVLNKDTWQMNIGSSADHFVNDSLNVHL